MNFSRRVKYTGQGKTVSHTGRKITVNFGLDVLQIFASYVISANQEIKFKGLLNMRNLFECLNMNVYEESEEKMKYIKFIQKGLEGRVTNRIIDPVVLAHFIIGSISEEGQFPIDPNSLIEIDTETVKWIDNQITTHLKFSFIDDEVDALQELCVRYKAKDFKTLEEIVTEFESTINAMQGKFRKAKVEHESEVTFSLRKDDMLLSLEDVHRRLTNPSNRIFLGAQGLNELFGGALESGREYMIAALAGTGKSMLLLDMALQMKKYNPYFKAKDPTKIPTVVYLTMENSLKETVERMYEMVCPNQGEFREHEVSEIMDMLMTQGELCLSDESPMNIIIKFMPNRSVDTTYLYTLAEDLEDEGYEMVCLLQDHVKRIKAESGQRDVRLELGDVTNEMHNFAVIKDIPLITVSHINREGEKAIEDATRSSKKDMISYLGKSNLGESALMGDNVDGLFLMTKEYDADGAEYIGLKRVKQRFKASMRNLLFFPLKENGRLVDDFDSPIPTFKESLKSSEQTSALFSNGIKNSPYQGMSMNNKSMGNNLEDLLQNNSVHIKPESVILMPQNAIPDINVFNSSSKSVEIEYNSSNVKDEDLIDIIEFIS